MNKKILWAVIILILIVGITAYLNRGNLALKKEIQDQALVLLKSDDQEIEMDLGEIKKLDVTTFPATIKSSGKDPRDATYTGVALKEIFDVAGLDYTDKKQVIVAAVDGYTVALSLQEVLADENVYLAFERDGEPLEKKEDGGTGPYQLIIRQDAFSQRWCKFVSEVKVQ